MAISTTISFIEKNTAGYMALQRELHALDNNHVKVGFPDSAKVGASQGKGSGHAPYSDISEVARVAIWNEFGVPNKKGGGWKIPPRPFFRNAIDSSKKPLIEFQVKLLKAVQDQKMTAEQAFNALGLWFVDKIRASIRAMKDPPNAPSTIAAKGSSHPLIDSGQLINSATYALVGGKPEAKK